MCQPILRTLETLQALACRWLAGSCPCIGLSHAPLDVFLGFVTERIETAQKVPEKKVTHTHTDTDTQIGKIQILTIGAES